MPLYEKIARSLAENSYIGHSYFTDIESAVDRDWRLWRTDSIVATKAILKWIKENPDKNLEELIETELKNLLNHGR
jgi:hypothetical protein